MLLELAACRMKWVDVSLTLEKELVISGVLVLLFHPRLFLVPLVDSRLFRLVQLVSVEIVQ